MNERTIWQFKNDYICIEDGSSATNEEIAIFKENQEKLQKDILELRKKDETKRIEWKSKYENKIIDYFDYEHEDIQHWDDEVLAYRLATSIFDKTPIGYYSPGKDSNPIKDFNEFHNYAKNHIDFQSFLDEIKSIFPDHYKMAVEYFLEGNHDT